MAALALGCLLAISAVSAQSLGDAAREEERKRPRRRPPGTVYTEQDLARIKAEREGAPRPSPSPRSAPKSSAAPAPAPSPEAASPVPSPEPEASPEPAPEPTEAPPSVTREMEEAAWRSRADQARRAIAAAQEHVRRLEAELEAVRQDRQPTNLFDPQREQTREAERVRLTGELEQARVGVAKALADMEALEDEARRSMIPPGWLRER